MHGCKAPSRARLRSVEPQPLMLEHQRHQRTYLQQQSASYSAEDMSVLSHEMARSAEVPFPVERPARQAVMQDSDCKFSKNFSKFFL